MLCDFSVSTSITSRFRLKMQLQWGTTDKQSCAIKLPLLFRAPAVWVVPVWLIHRLMRVWCHLYAILIGKHVLQQKELSIHFKYLFLLLLISLETTTPHVKRVLLYSRFYKHKFLQLPHQLMAGLYIWFPLYDTLYIIDLQCTFSVVSSLIQISTRSTTAGHEMGLFTATLCLQMSRYYFLMTYLLDFKLPNIKNNYFEWIKRKVNP